jgi:hypothetical protein
LTERGVFACRPRRATSPSEWAHEGLERGEALMHGGADP